MTLDDLVIESSYEGNTVIVEDTVARGNTTQWKMSVFQEPSVGGGNTIDSHVRNIHCYNPYFGYLLIISIYNSE